MLVETNRAREGQQLERITLWIQYVLTAIESSTSCGRLEPLTPGAAEANRAGVELRRGARNAAQTLLEANRAAIVKVRCRKRQCKKS